MLINNLGVTRYVKASAGRANLRVVFEDECNPRHDGETIYLPKVTAKTTEEELEDIMASTDHEVAHDLYSDFSILREKGINSHNSPLGFIWNLLEDSRVNALEAMDYEGFRELWDKTCPRILDKIREKTVDLTPLNKLIKSLIKWDTKLSADMFPQCDLSGSKFETDPKIDEILAPFSDRLIKAQEETRKKPGSKLTYDLARDIFRALGGNPDEEERRVKEPIEIKITTEPGELSKGTKEKDSKEKSDAKTPVKESDKKKEDDKAEVKEEDWALIRVELKNSDSKLISTHDVDKEHMSKVGLLYHVPIVKDSVAWKITPLDQFAVVDYVKHTTVESSLNFTLDTTSVATDFFVASFNTRVKDAGNPLDDFAQQVRRLIQIRAKSTYEYGLKRGKMDYSRLSRLALRSPGFSERVFKSKVINNTLNAAVTVLVDMSGSMSGDKTLFSCKAAVLLNQVFFVLKVPCEIIGFTDANFKAKGFLPIIYLYKPFSTLNLSTDNLVSYIGASSKAMKGNPDGDAILWAYDRLIKRKEKKKLLIVMSDGQPAASIWATNLAAYTRQVIQEIEVQKKVEIYGLGLLDESVKEYYKHNSTVSTAEEIPTKLLELIERKLLND